MAFAPTVRSALAGAALGGLATVGLVWATPSPWMLVPAVTLAGAALGWALDRHVYRPLRELLGRLASGEAVSPPVRAGSKAVARLGATIDRTTADLRERIETVEGARSHLREILESMSDGVMVVDRTGRVELHNPAFAALFAARDPRPGLTVLELTRSPALAGFLDRLRTRTGASSERIESESGRSLELRGRPLAGERLVVVARDLTEQLRLDATRRDLVANVSHELRTPLTAIRGYAENLRDGALDDPPTADRFLGRILAQCTRLEALLEDLLALSRFEGDRPVDLQPGVDLAALVEGALETVRGLAAERRVELRYDTPAVSPVAGNEEALERLLLNLLENAIKYNREGGHVAVGLSMSDGELVLEVADSGIGVPRQDLPRIFERFYRVDAGRSRDEGGTGLGLAIVKHAAQLHGGRVEVESDLGRGSIFRVFLPASG